TPSILGCQNWGRGLAGISSAGGKGRLEDPCLPSQQRLPTAEPCRLPLDEGSCQRYTLRWYYNQRARECRPFVYSGCQGNPNRFHSKEECELHSGRPN
uniref:BPTI/Kunitz inhibitor domain-containing protein n=1 Tax=Serinus canaria TaxID=9135 RepID=A0A8C9MNC6_SERCA